MRVLHDSSDLLVASNDVWGTRSCQTRRPLVLRNKPGDLHNSGNAIKFAQGGYTVLAKRWYSTRFSWNANLGYESGELIEITWNTINLSIFSRTHG